MKLLRVAIFPVFLAGAALIYGCTQGNSGDEASSDASAVPIGLDRFLLFPNPIVEVNGDFQTNTGAYSQAYYAAVDPNSERNTLTAWKSKNQFGTGGAEFVAVFRDVRDLGYGRRMTGRRNADGSIAFLVENYNVDAVPGGYSQVNVDAAVARDERWHVGTNAIEWSPAQCTPADPPDCASSVNFTKYFNFDPVSGQRQNALDIDGRGQKAMPGVCISCHGGRADPLTPLSTFALVENALSRKRGDVQARLQPFNVDSFEWSAAAGFARADQEAVLKIFNQWVLCSYPGGGTVSAAWGTCSAPPAGVNEWQGAAVPLIQNWYGGAAMPNAQFSDTYLPAGWNASAADVELYRKVVVPFCRTCHLLRGTANQSDIDFDSEAKFRGYAARIKTHVFDRGNMPLAFLVYQDFWKSNGPTILASYIDSVLGAGTATTSSGAEKRPGRPVADPGPSRMVRTGANATLYGGNSLFATTYNWTLDPSTPGVSISNSSSATATFFSNFSGSYIVHLTVGGNGRSDSKSVVVTVDDSFRDPATLKFAHVKDVLQNGTTCTTCHLPRAVVQPSATPPIWYTNFDRNFSGTLDAVDDAWFFREIEGRVNWTDINGSALLQKPIGTHHNGGAVFNVATPAALAKFSIVYNWILNGAPAGGVAANAGADSASVVNFSGAPATAALPLDASASIGATSFAWSLVSANVAAHPNGSPAAGTPPSITNANLPAATLNVFDIGTYVVRLTVSNGADTDFADRTITVSETPVTAVAAPAGSVAVAFSGAPLAGTISLDSAGSAGNPLAYSWSYSPSGFAGACGTISNATSAVATLTVPATAVGNSCTFLLTASNLSMSDQTSTTITVASAGSGIVANAGANSTNALSFGNPSVTLGIPDSTGIPQATLALVGSASTGPGTLAYSWSVFSQPGNATGAYAANIASVSSVNTTLTVHRKGTYVVQLFVDNGLPPGPSNTASRTITVNVASGNTFTAMKTTFVNRGCTAAGCHQSGSTAPPSWVDETVSALTLYQRVLARVADPGNPANNLILICPAEGTCGMGQQPGFHDLDVSSYAQFLNWVIDGTPNN
jgi:hypothetical protein